MTTGAAFAPIQKKKQTNRGYSQKPILDETERQRIKRIRSQSPGWTNLEGSGKEVILRKPHLGFGDIIEIRSFLSFSNNYAWRFNCRPSGSISYIHFVYPFLENIVSKFFPLFTAFLSTWNISNGEQYC